MLELEMNELTQEELKMIEEHRRKKEEQKEKLDLKEIMNRPMNEKPKEEYTPSPAGLIEAAKDKQYYEDLENDYYKTQMKLKEYNKQNLEITDKIRTTELELLEIFKK